MILIFRTIPFSVTLNNLERSFHDFRHLARANVSKMERFIASETSHPSRNVIKNRRQLFDI